MKIYISRFLGKIGFKKEHAIQIASIYTNKTGKLSYDYRPISFSFLPIPWQPVDEEKKATSSFVVVITRPNKKKGIRLYYYYQSGNSGSLFCGGKCLPLHNLRMYANGKANQAANALPPRLKKHLEVL